MDIFKKTTKPLKLEDAREILDLFGWNNIEFIELEGCTKGDKYTPFSNVEITKCIKHYIVINKPSKKDFNYIIAKNNSADMDIIDIHAGFKNGQKISLSLPDCVLKLSEGLSITM